MRSSTLLGCIGGLLLASWASAEELSAHFDPDKMMPSSQIERGMKAVGKSVFSGVEISQFNMEILAVMEKSNLGKDMIVARILDGPVVERKSGVMGGMSGSPVYIDGRLIGAVAFTWSFEKEPIAGITTIDSMLEALDKPRDKATTSAFATDRDRLHARRGSFNLAGHEVSAVQIVPKGQATRPFADARTIRMYPVAPPLYCAGLPPAAMDYLKKALAPYGIEPVAGPGALRKPVDVKLEPGAAFGVPLLWGDFDISTGGTVTYVDGDLLLGFGHPFAELGNIDMPLTTSWVHDFVPKYDRTDKMMSVMKEVGVLTQDRNWAVGGKLGPTAGRVPLTVTVSDLTRDVKKTYHMQALKHRDMTISMVLSGTLSALMAAYNSPGEGMVRVKTRVKGSRGDEMAREDVYYHTGSPASSAIGTALDAAALLTQNRFRPQDISEVALQAELSDADNTAALEGLFAEETVARAGEDLHLRVRLRPDDGDIVEKKVTLKMPLWLQKGRLRIGASSGAAAMSTRGRLGIMPPSLYSLDAAIKQFESIEQGDQLFIAAGAPTKELTIYGTKLLGLPGAMIELFGGAPRTDLARGGAEISRLLDVPWVIYGSAQLTIATEDREGGRGKVTPSGPPPSRKPESAYTLPPLPEGVPAGLWWAATAFPRTDSFTSYPQPAYQPPLLKPIEAKKPDEKKADEKKPDKPSAPPAKESKDDKPKDDKEGAVGRKPSVWVQTTSAHFSAGEVDNIAVRSDGAVQLAPSWVAAKPMGEVYVWCLAAGADAAYAGTVNDGNVYRLDGTQRTLLCETGYFGISCLHVTEGGDVLAGTFPDGPILHIDAKGEASTLCQLKARYVWDIISDGEHGYYAATGPDAAVYHIDAQGKAEQLVTIRQTHATRLLLAGEDLYIGTADNAAVYRLGPDKRLVSVLDGGDGDVTGLIEDGNGSILVSLTPIGKVISLAKNGRATTLLEPKGAGVMGLARAGERLFAALNKNARIIEIIDAQTHAVLREKENTQTVALCALAGKVYAASSNPAGIAVADLAAQAEGSLESDVLDAKRTARWGRVDWQARVPDGAGVSLRLRSGNSEDPEDGSWSAWSYELSSPGRDKAGVPAGRFLQYRLQMHKAAGARDPALEWLRVSYLPANQRPKLSSPTPVEGQAIRGKFKLKWKAQDLDKDKLQAKLLVRPRGERDFKLVKEHITKSEYEWDTKGRQDSVYDLRIVVDDALSNPAGAEETFIDIANVAVDNTPPEVELRGGPSVQEDGSVALTGFALDATCAIGNIAWQAEGEDVWHAVRLVDGLYDWRYEDFLITTGPLKETVGKLTIRARDAAGNVMDKTAKIPDRKTKAGTK